MAIELMQLGISHLAILNNIHRAAKEESLLGWKLDKDWSYTGLGSYLVYVFDESAPLLYVQIEFDRNNNAILILHYLVDGKMVYINNANKRLMLEARIIASLRESGLFPELWYK